MNLSQKSYRKMICHSENVRICFVLLSLGLIICIRFHQPIFGGTFWQDDGYTLFPESVTDGLKSVYTPAFSTLVLVQRLIALFTKVFLLGYAPYVYCVASALVYTLPLIYFISNSFAWLVPSQYQRAVLVLLLSIGPGSSEVFGNLICLAYVITSILALTLLDDNASSRPWFVPAWIFGIASSNSVPLLLPLALVRCLTDDDQRFRWPVFLALLGLFAHLALAMY